MLQFTIRCYIHIHVHILSFWDGGICQLKWITLHEYCQGAYNSKEKNNIVIRGLHSENLFECSQSLAKCESRHIHARPYPNARNNTPVLNQALLRRHRQALQKPRTTSQCPSPVRVPINGQWTVKGLKEGCTIPGEISCLGKRKTAVCVKLWWLAIFLSKQFVAKFGIFSFIDENVYFLQEKGNIS